MARDITDGAIVHQRKWRIIHCQGKVQPQEKNRRPMGLSFDPRKILQSCTKMHERWSATGEQPGSSGLGSAHVGVVYLTIATRECSIHLKRYSKLPSWIVGVLWQLWHLVCWTEVFCWQLTTEDFSEQEDMHRQSTASWLQESLLQANTLETTKRSIFRNKQWPADRRLLKESLLHAVKLPKFLAKEDLSMDVMGAKSLVQQVLWQMCGSLAAQQIEPDAFWPRTTVLEAEKNEMEAAMQLRNAVPGLGHRSVEPGMWSHLSLVQYPSYLALASWKPVSRLGLSRQSCALRWQNQHLMLQGVLSFHLTQIPEWYLSFNTWALALSGSIPKIESV